MHLIKAGDIMIPLDKYPHIPYWFTLRQAMAEVENSEIEIGGRKSLPRAVLVFDETYRLVGVIRRRTLLLGLEPHLLQINVKPFKQQSSKTDPITESLIRNIKAQADQPVKDIMSQIEHTVDYDDHIITVMKSMVENDQNLLPVLKDGSVAGVVRTVDVFHEIWKILQ